MITAIRRSLGIASTAILNVLNKKETVGELTNRNRIGRPRKTKADEHKNIVSAVRKKKQTVTSPTTSKMER